MSDVMLSLFKSQLDAEGEKLAIEHELNNRGQQLIWWYFIRLFTLDPDEAGIVCDGSGDLGIDAIWIDDNDVVHFYQFKNPVSMEDEINAGEIDKMISGLRLIIERQHEKIANQTLKSLVSSIFQMVPSKYVIHVVTSGKGIPHESIVKLNALVQSLGAKLFSWTVENLQELQDRFYARTVPSIDEPLVIDLHTPPYIVRSGDADSYFFTAPGTFLAEQYTAHGERLLERNIRVDQGDTTTNRSIEQTCSSEDSVNFVHYNNGVTFLCRSARYDNVIRQMRLEGSQVVNGGQTIRAVYRAHRSGLLRKDVIVPVRAITGSNDRNFANDVAVNQNNQNRMGAGFLRSTDARVVQLDHALASLGWYLERREGELDSLTPEDRVRAETRIGKPINENVIRMKDGLQAYVATFFEQPELAKKNIRLVFLSEEDGGYFEKVFENLSAEKFVVAHLVKTRVDLLIKKFAALKRRKDRVVDWKSDYSALLGEQIVEKHGEVIDQMMPQSAVFLCGAIYQRFVRVLHQDPLALPQALEFDGSSLICDCVLLILDFARDNPRIANKSWPSLLKSQSFFNSFTAVLKPDLK